jgi:phosphotransferase system  glucose/maltose/N-acetylglucosamine-specific IIC component
MKFKAIFITSDEILKGLCLAVTLYACLSLTAASGGCLNPWLGLVQNIYVTGLVNGVVGNGSFWSSAIWVYIGAPFIGAIFAPLFLVLVSSMDRAKRHEESPMKGAEYGGDVERVETV